MLKRLAIKQLFARQYPDLLSSFDDLSLSIDSFCAFVRIACKYYFQQVSAVSIGTSKKMKSVSVRAIHLKRRRAILENLFQ